MELVLKADNEEVESLYVDHSFYNEGDSGLDLFFPGTITINPGETKLVNLKIKCEVKKYSTMLINTSLYENKSYWLLPRSSIYKTPLRMANSIGLIDAKYRGNLVTPLDNISDEPYVIEKGVRLFQIAMGTLEPFKLVVSNSELSTSTRGTGGLGSTGK